MCARTSACACLRASFCARASLRECAHTCTRVHSFQISNYEPLNRISDHCFILTFSVSCFALHVKNFPSKTKTQISPHCFAFGGVCSGYCVCVRACILACVRARVTPACTHKTLYTRVLPCMCVTACARAFHQPARAQMICGSHLLSSGFFSIAAASLPGFTPGKPRKHDSEGELPSPTKPLKALKQSQSPSKRTSLTEQKRAETTPEALLHKASVTEGRQAKPSPVGASKKKTLEADMHAGHLPWGTVVETHETGSPAVRSHTTLGRAPVGVPPMKTVAVVNPSERKGNNGKEGEGKNRWMSPFEGRCVCMRVRACVRARMGFCACTFAWMPA